MSQFDGYIYSNGVKIPAPSTIEDLEDKITALTLQLSSHAKSINDLIDLLDSILKVKKV